MRILLAKGGGGEAEPEPVLTRLAALLEARRAAFDLSTRPPAALAAALSAAVGNGAAACRYSGSDPDEPALAAVDGRALAQLAPEGFEAAAPTVVVALLDRRAAASIAPFEPTGRLIGKSRFTAHLALPGRDLADPAELLWFADALGEFVLERLGREAFLEGCRWNPGIRMREEETGGLLFVPETSQLVELDPVAFEAVRRSVDESAPRLLAADALDDFARVIAALSVAGAIDPIGSRP